MPTIANPRHQNRQGQHEAVFPAYTPVSVVYGLPRWRWCKEPTCQRGRRKRLEFDPRVGMGPRGNKGDSERL